ncbi:MAG: gluconate 2-dehydrogenase subunit 3 family protein [Actinomycetota bacterium]|nr:gluconate 2-dehydrogenase subunit 3 family protein [Actinomycetota bacterium]
MRPSAGFFNEHQRATVEAAMARIIPTDDTPGAREAGTVDFVDRYLCGIEFVYAKPDGTGFEQLEGKRADAWRQRLDVVRQQYVEGVEALDRAGVERFGARFVELTNEQQDDVLTELDRPEQEHELEQARVTLYGAPVETPLQQTNAEIDLSFVPLLALHTRQGFYSDPIYGGNRDQVGWKVIGFPGPASLAEVHSGRYSTLDYFAENRMHPGQED